MNNIYTGQAYKVLDSRGFERYLSEIVELTKTNIREELEELYTSVLLSPAWSQLVFAFSDDDSEPSDSVCARYFQYTMSEDEAHGKPNDLGVKITYYKYDGSYYLLLSAGTKLRKVFDFLKADPRVLDMSYYQGGRPADIPASDWHARWRLWSTILRYGMAEGPFEVPILNSETFFSLDPSGTRSVAA